MPLIVRISTILRCNAKSVSRTPKLDTKPILCDYILVISQRTEMQNAINASLIKISSILNPKLEIVPKIDALVLRLSSHNILCVGVLCKPVGLSAFSLIPLPFAPSGPDKPASPFAPC